MYCACCDVGRYYHVLRLGSLVSNLKYVNKIGKKLVMTIYLYKIILSSLGFTKNMYGVVKTTK